MQIDYVKLIVSIGGCLIIGAIAGLFTSSSIESWYSKLNKPSFNPPNWIFGPVWTLLYVLMGISVYLVWTSESVSGSSLAITLFLIQLLLNFLWSFLFFYFKNPFIAFIEILLLLVMIIVTTIQFYPISTTAALLFIPYILWVSFATILNFSIWWLNK